MGFGASRLDVRLVPAALVSWIVTAAGIVWPIGNVCALCCVVVALGGGALWWCVARRSWHAPRLGSISAGLVAVGMVGAGYGLAVALRSGRSIATQSPWHLAPPRWSRSPQREPSVAGAGPVDVPGDGSTAAG